LLNFGA